MKRKPKVSVVAKAVYIDPADCGSIVGYHIWRSNWLSAEVDLMDCNHKITWYFCDKADAVAKIDNAIAALVEFRTEFLAARKKFVQRKRRKR